MAKNNNYQNRVIKNVLGLSAEKLNYAGPGFSWFVDVGRDRVSFNLKRVRSEEWV